MTRKETNCKCGNVLAKDRESILAEGKDLTLGDIVVEFKAKNPFQNWYIIESDSGKTADGFPTGKMICTTGLKDAKKLALLTGIKKKDLKITKYGEGFSYDKE